MKKSIFIQLLSVAAFVLIAASCNKEAINQNESTNGSTGPSLVGENEPNGTGSLAGTILPPEANVVIYLKGNNEAKVFVNEKGEILPNSIPAGHYTLTIVPSNPAYSAMVINDIEIKAGEVHNLGTIWLK
jgi:hypothetical protein